MSDDRSDAWEKVLRERGHEPVMREGKLDFFAAEFNGTCNGPACEKCGWSCCWHCECDPETSVPLTCKP